MFDRLATKQDLQAMQQELTRQLTLRMGVMIAVGFAVMGALLKLLP